jgi:hypothetical protein
VPSSSSSSSFILIIRSRGVNTKRPKSMTTQSFTETAKFKIYFPEDASVDQKVLLTGLAVFIKLLLYFDEKGIARTVQE